jgi:cytochrome P450
MVRYPLNTPQSQDVDTGATRLLADAPLVRAQMGDGPEVWLALGYDVVRQVLSDPRFSREAAMGPNAPVTLRSAYDPDVLTSQDPPRHSRTRRLMARAFSPRMVEQLEPRIQDIVDGLLAGLASHGPPADLVPMYAEPLPIMVICELLGVPYADRDAIRGWSDRLMATTAYTPSEIAGAVQEIRAYLSELVAARRAAPRDDLTTALAQVTDGGDTLSEIELVANLQMLLIGGHETTVNQIGNSLVALFRHPAQLALLRERPELANQAVEELLRYSRLVSSTLPRVATADVEIGGVVIKSGEGVLALPGGGNQDPAAFPEPDRLDITRQNPAHHLGFGHGIHYCLGAPLARLELRTALSSLLAEFPALELAVPESDLVWKDGTPVRALRKLPVSW